MENMEKGLTVTKWVLIIRPKIAQFVCLSAKVWESVVRGGYYNDKDMNQEPVSSVHCITQYYT